MATRQPKLPDYQLRKLPNYGAYIGQVTAAGVSAMNKLGERNKKKEEKRDKLIKEGDVLERQYMDYWATKKGSSINEMDTNNREWAQGRASRINELYQKAYGSNGTKEDRNAFKTFEGAAKQDLNMIGTYANLMAGNTKAITSDIKAREQGTNVSRLTKNSLYGAAEKQYTVGSHMANGANNIKTYNDPDNNHLMISYNVPDPKNPGKNKQDINGNDIVYTDDIFTAVQSFNQTGENLESFAIKEDQNLSDKGYANFQKDILNKGLLNVTGLTTIKTHYNKETGVYTKRKVINKEGFINQLNSGDENSQKLNRALDSTLTKSDFNTQFYQLNAEGYNTDGVGKTLPLTDLAWKIGNQLTDKEIDDINHRYRPTTSVLTDEGDLDYEYTPDQDKYTYKGETLTDPTPSDGKLTREDLNAIQEESAKMMLVDFYGNQTPEGEEEQMRTDRFDYQKKDDGSYTESQKRDFNSHRPIYNAIIKHSEGGGNKYGGIYNYENGKPTTNSLGTLENYANYLNQINATKSGGDKKPAIKYMTGKAINADPTGPDNKDPDKIYKVSMGAGGQIAHINTSNFNKGDLSLTADIFYGNVMGEYNLDGEIQTYLSKPINSK